MLNVISYGIGTIVGFMLLAIFIFWLVRDITQTKHTVLRNYPVIGRMRYVLERQGEFFRQYFFAGERDEMPFNRATRSWIYRIAKGLGGDIGFGSTHDMREPGGLIFVNATFPLLEEERLPTPSLVRGEGYCAKPFTARSIINISAMSFGVISEPAVQALSRGAEIAGCWLNTGEGGLARYHQTGRCDLVMQIGTAKYGIRDVHGALSKERALVLGEMPEPATQRQVNACV